MSTDTIIEFPSLIAGAIYQIETVSGHIEQIVCTATEIRADGSKWGLVRRVGYSDERIREGAEEMVSWKLIWAPNQSPAPALSEISPRTNKPTRKYSRKDKATKK